MPRRYVFGPVSTEFADHYLLAPRQDGTCRTFNQDGSTDVQLGPDDTWDAVCARLPPAGQPEFILLDLPYHTIPACLWTASVPLVGLADDWEFLWHGYRHLAQHCDLLFTDPAGVEALTRAGFSHARPGRLLAWPPALLDLPEGPRDIDILFVGNLSATVQRERLPWLARLACLSDRRRVVIQTGVFGDDYHALLARARIVFNRGRHGAGSRRALEAIAAGALLFQEEGNREVPAFFRDRQECVYYNAGNLEELLEHYLDHEDERRTLAGAARRRVRNCTFEAMLGQLVERIDTEWDGLHERSRRRCEQPHAPHADFAARTWQALHGQPVADPHLVHDLARAADGADVSATAKASLLNALGLAVTVAAQEQGRTTAALAAIAVAYFRRAVECDPNHTLASLNFAESLVGAGDQNEAITQARRTLTVLEQTPNLDPTTLDGPHFPPAWDVFRVEWERAAWVNAGQPAAEAQAKRDLLRWRLHSLLGDLTGQLAHRFQAVFARPGLPGTRTDLGVALLQANQAAEAIEHLRQALNDNPFDRLAAHACFHALGAVGDAAGQRRFAHERRLLARAVPQRVPEEAWFMDAPPPGD